MWQYEHNAYYLVVGYDRFVLLSRSLFTYLILFFMTSFEKAVAILRIAYNEGNIDQFDDILAYAYEVYWETLLDEIFKPII